MREIEILENGDLVSTRAAELFIEIAQYTIANSGEFNVALSGGSTPESLYRKLSQTEFDWSRVEFYFGDERIVPPDDHESNFRMVSETLFKPLKISENRIHRWRTELSDRDEMARDYQKQLDELGTPPRFDLTLLGIGEDCHTASLFPNSDGLHETTRSAIWNWVPRLQTYRLTITFPVINNSANVLVIATGSSKAMAINQAIKGECQPSLFPIQALHLAHGREIWVLDKDAASML